MDSVIILPNYLLSPRFMHRKMQAEAADVSELPAVLYDFYVWYYTSVITIFQLNQNNLLLWELLVFRRLLEHE